MDYSLYEWSRDKANGTVSVTYFNGSGATRQGADVIARSLIPNARLYAKGETFGVAGKNLRLYWDIERIS